MIRRIEIANFRLLRSVAVDLEPFQALLGQNGSGKSTLLAALDFISHVVELGVQAAVQRQALNFYDLCFSPDLPLCFAVEIEDPRLSPAGLRLRYELEVSIDDNLGLGCNNELLIVVPAERDRGSGYSATEPKNWREFTNPPTAWVPLFYRRNAFKGGADEYKDPSGGGVTYRFGPERSGLGSVPPDWNMFPWVLGARDRLKEGVRLVLLEASKLKAPAPPGGGTQLREDGGNLPAAVRAFEKRDRVLFDQWVRTLAVAVEGLERVEVREREEDRHLVLEAVFSGQRSSRVPSWLLSDGTLRLMALTLIAFATEADQTRTYLIEEPENGLHPLAIQVVNEVLSRPPEGAQFLVASHSPVLLSQVTLDQTLVFRRLPDGFSSIRRGQDMPELHDWAAGAQVADLFVSGILS